MSEGFCEHLLFYNTPAIGFFSWKAKASLQEPWLNLADPI